MAAEPRTADLLRRWHEGDEDSLSALIARILPWMQKRVRFRLGPLLRRRGDTQDFVQEAMVEVLRDGPRFVVSDDGQLRELFARIVENLLRDEHRRQTAARRDVRREIRLASDSVLDLDAGGRAVTTPSQAAEANEWASLVRLCLGFVSPRDREILLLRQWQELSFEEIGKRLAIPAKTAHMRFVRALPRLVAQIRKLREGRLAELLGEDGSTEAACT
jgi:RNA polymerase sigma-70 factor (ECF subfamily)